jgi:endoglucanase
MDARILQSKRVLIGKERVPGIIGSMAIHLLDVHDMVPLKVNQLYIDIGCTTKAEAEGLVKPGDTAIFASDFVRFGEGLIKAKALDDRVGCAILLSALEERYPVTLAAVFAVQEEIGSKGAQVAAYRIGPDAGIALEGTTCADMHGVDEHLKVTRIGQGPVISIIDRSAIPHRRFRDFMTATADEHAIPWQYRQGTFGGTDAGALQRAKGGCPVCNISVPTRYIHSPVNVIAEKDYENAQMLLKLVLGRMDRFLEVE